MCSGVVVDRVRSDTVPQSDGSVQLRRRWNDPWLCRAEAEWRSQEVHVSLGWVHHRLWVPVIAQDQVTLPDARSSGHRPQRSSRCCSCGHRYDRGSTEGPWPVRHATVCCGKLYSPNTVCTAKATKESQQKINQSNNGHRCVMQLPIVLILLKNLSVRLFNLYLPKPVITVPSYRWLMRK